VSIRSSLLVASAAVAFVFAAVPALAAPGAKQSDAGCFLTENWSGWKSPSPDVIYLRVNSNVYRLDLSAGSEELNEPDVHLTSIVRGSDWICSPLDLQLAVVDEYGAFRQPLIVKTITKLTPDEIKAIPAKFRP
jgi:hypothetical protein